MLNFLYRHLVHASDYDQGEALLKRWGPDNVGKLGSTWIRIQVEAHIIIQVI